MSVYDHYPGDRNQYPLGNPAEFPYPKEDFQRFTAGNLIAKSSAKDPDADLIVTSGTLICEMKDGAKKGFTTNHNFRMLCNPMDRQIMKRVRLTDCKTTYFGIIDRWHSNIPAWAGMHIFARYQTENDLYVASYRSDAYVTIKKKVKGTYKTLIKTTMSEPPLAGKEYTLAFEADGDRLTFYIDNKQVLTTTDKDLDWGTTGVRLDYADSYVDYVKIEKV